MPSRGALARSCRGRQCRAARGTTNACELRYGLFEMRSEHSFELAELLRRLLFGTPFRPKNDGHGVDRGTTPQTAGEKDSSTSREVSSLVNFSVNVRGDQSAPTTTRVSVDDELRVVPESVDSLRAARHEQENKCATRYGGNRRDADCMEGCAYASISSKTLSEENSWPICVRGVWWIQLRETRQFGSCGI